MERAYQKYENGQARPQALRCKVLCQFEVRKIQWIFNMENAAREQCQRSATSFSMQLFLSFERFKPS